MEDYIVRTHPVNPLRVVIFCVDKGMKMLAVNEDLEPGLAIKPATNFYKASFINLDKEVLVHFCVMSTVTKEVLDWDDQLILNAVKVFNDSQHIGELQNLKHTGPDVVIHETEVESIPVIA